MARSDLDAFVVGLADGARSLRHELDRAGVAGAAGGLDAGATAQLFVYGSLCARWFEAHARAPGAGRALLDARLGGNRVAARAFAHVAEAAGELAAARAIAAAVASADLEAMFAAGGSGASGIARSYERFLAAYAPGLRRARGVYFTPAPVAAYVVRALDRVLREEIALEAGLASTADASGAPLHVLDPACGTGAFLAEVVRLAHRTLAERHRRDGLTPVEAAAAWRAYVRGSLLGRLRGIELMPVAHAVCHAHLAILFAELGCELESGDVIDVRLGDALEADHGIDVAAGRAPGGIVVAMNPPYRRGTRAGDAASASRAEPRDPYRAGLDGERNLQPLSDDYIRFVRVAQRAVEARAWGVVGLVGNSTFLSGRLHRAMRASLGTTFDVVEVTDLHGSARVRSAPAGLGRDENVFDIGQGVAVVVMCRGPRNRSGVPDTASAPSVRYAELRGSRAAKEAALDAATLPAPVAVSPAAPLHLWVPRAETPAEYVAFVALDELFTFHSVGAKPGDDPVLVGFTREEVLAQLARARARVQPGAAAAGMTEAMRKLRRVAPEHAVDPGRVVPYAYRPFDTRWVYDDPAIWTRPVLALRARIDGEPLLLTSRVVKSGAFAHVFASRTLPDVIFLSATSSENCHVFPMSTICTEVAARALDREVSARELFAYAYAVLHSPGYRARYAPALALNFPRVPLVRSPASFAALAEVGADLLALHLGDVEASLPAHAWPRFIDGGDRRVAHAGRRGWAPAEAHGETSFLALNDASGFAPVPPEAWAYRVGGYQVLRKWLVDRARAGRELDDRDVEHYRRTVAIIRHSLALTSRIDACVAEHGGWSVPAPGLPPAREDPGRVRG